MTVLKHIKGQCLTTLILVLTANGHVSAEDPDGTTFDLIKVIGVTPLQTDLQEDTTPFAYQTATSDDLDRIKSLNLSDFMRRNLSGVSVNDAQNNPLQPDIQYRGFTASPLLGLPQGLAVYQDGVRVNEAFGDAVNWDLIPESSMANINLIGGANPVFGLNTLGGAISITTKDGFSHPGHTLESYGGSFDRIVSTIESGANNGIWGYYFTGNYFDEDGWRDASESDALNLFGGIDWRGDHSNLSLLLNHGDTKLIGNGSIPVELAEQRRRSIFTSPDITENDMYLVNLVGEHELNDKITLTGNAFYRTNDTDSFNGDGSEFEECDVTGLGEVLVEIDDDDLAEACEMGMTVTRMRIENADGEIVEDQDGNPIEAEIDSMGDNRELNAINNISQRNQKSFGGNWQTAFLHDLAERQNILIVGAAYNQALTDFWSIVEIAYLNDDRSTTGTSKYAVEEGTQIKTHTRTWSLYFTDTLAVLDNLILTLSGRYNDTRVAIGDRSRQNPLVDPEDPDELNGEHDFERFNPAVGVNWSFHQDISAYASYGESSRAPTPVELACADPDAPCNLPNAFLADPPLEQVVTKSFELGLRGNLAYDIKWNVGGFHSVNTDDIIFISTGGVSSNEGFFDNIGDTKRLGAELGLSGSREKFDWFANYSFLSATFADSFTASSPNHPMASDEGEINVTDGDRIPGLPQHSLKIGGNFRVTPQFSIGLDLLYNSSQYYRGDEANLLDPIDGYAVVNARVNYQFNKNISLFANIDNVLNTDYETFGLLGEPDEISGFEDFENNRFVGVAAPRAVFVGTQIKF